MIITYDKKYNIGYIQFREKMKEIETIKISDEMNIDISPDGKIYGIELLNANEQIDYIKNNKIEFINKEENKTKQITIT